MNRKEQKNSDKMIRLVELIAEKVVYHILRKEQVVALLPCVVATYNSTNNNATLFIPPDLDNESILYYPNKTGSALTSGDKVYLIYRFGEADQGWIGYR